jgi:NAD(P)-dependent dehydrogenase (short-subunit alcohol dehydrogenase family)
MSTEFQAPFEKNLNTSEDSEQEMKVKPVFEREYDRQPQKLKDKVAIITGGDSGIGKAVAVHFAREGADVVIVYRQQSEDAEETKQLVEEKGRKALAIQCDISSEDNCIDMVERVMADFGKIDIVVNNAAIQFPQDSLEEISEEQLDRTFRTNIYSFFFVTKAALKYLKEGSSIINTTSVTAYKGNPGLIDYSSTKGAIVTFTRSLSQSLAEKGIRVNAVAPGPIWTPLITSTMPDETFETFGKDTPMKRSGQPAEVAPCYVFLASEDSSYITGQILHPNGGTVVNS